MKKAIYLIAACAVAICISCGGNKVEKNDSTAAGAETAEIVKTAEAQTAPPEITMEFDDCYKSFRLLSIDSTRDDQKCYLELEFTLAKPVPKNKMGDVWYTVFYYDANGVRLHNGQYDPRYLSKKTGREVKNEEGETVTFEVSIPKEYFSKVSKIHMRD